MKTVVILAGITASLTVVYFGGSYAYKHLISDAKCNTNEPVSQEQGAVEELSVRPCDEEETQAKTFNYENIQEQPSFKPLADDEKKTDEQSPVEHLEGTQEQPSFKPLADDEKKTDEQPSVEHLEVLNETQEQPSVKHLEGTQEQPSFKPLADDEKKTDEQPSVEHLEGTQDNHIEDALSYEEETIQARPSYDEKKEDGQHLIDEDNQKQYLVKPLINTMEEPVN